MIDFKNLVVDFFELVKDDKVEIYNEFSLQHEFGIFLRSRTSLNKFKIQFERPISYFGLSPKGFLKKEMDIIVFSADMKEKYTLEFKYPRNGRYPEEMYSACKDICFLEQLIKQGFSKGVFIFVGDDNLRWTGPERTGIYQYFRNKTPIHGNIKGPTGGEKDKRVLTIGGSYPIIWNTIDDKHKYAMVEI